MANDIPDWIEPLTDRESEVLYAIAEGLSNQEIANGLFIALTTVKWHNTQIFGKLGVKNRTEALNKAISLGLLEGQIESLSPDVPHNLPQQLSPFIGRHKELHQLGNLLNKPSIRLITVLATGGMGKTCLALQIGQTMLADFSDGVFFVDLAPLSKHELIIPTIAEALGLLHYDKDHNLNNAILNYLSAKELLLILDNFEHLLDAAPIILNILQAAPQVKIVVTSRERLNIVGENCFVLSGMAVPVVDSENPVEYDAIRLFLDGAQRVNSDYVLDEDDLPHLIDICQMVEGMPLAIELASGWMDMLLPENIVQELRTSMDILETDIRGIPERHRSIRVTFNHTWERLSTEEQNSMMCLSIFRGSFKLEAAEIVANAHLRVLRCLVNKALLHVDSHGRYRIQGLLRQYFEERLLASGKYEDILDKHATYYANYLGKAIPLPSFGVSNPTCFKELGSEIDNLLMAWEYIISQEKIECLHHLSLLAYYLLAQGRRDEAITLSQDIIALVQAKMTDEPDLIRLYGFLSLQQIHIQRHSTNMQLTEVATQVRGLVDLLEPLGYSNELMCAYTFMEDAIYWTVEQYPQIEQNLLKALGLAEIHGDMLWQATILIRLAYLHYRMGNQEAALSILQKSEPVLEQQDFTAKHPWFVFLYRVYIYIDAKMYEKAELLVDENLFLCEQAEWIYGISYALTAKMRIAYVNGKISQAKHHCAAIIRWHQTHARDWQMLGALGDAYALHLLAQIGQNETAVEILSLVLHHPNTVLFTLDIVKRHLNKLREGMDEDSFEAAFERGKQLELKQVVADAIVFLTID